MSNEASSVLEGLTKPATVLIEKIAGAVGTLYRPRQIVREARAEAEADKIKALVGIEISEIQQRGLVRFIEQQGREQKNIEDITAGAIPDLNDDAKPENIEDDWLASFFQKCKHVTDTEMQSLWSKLLAGEANQPSTFSKRTVEFVSSLDKSDAQLFTSLCTFVWDGLHTVESLDDGNEMSLLLLYNPNDAICKANGISFRAVTHLDAIGLVKHHPQGLTVPDLPKRVLARYYGTPLVIEFSQKEGNALSIGQVVLTKVGEELAPICGSVKIDGVIDHVVAKWIELGYAISSPYPPR